MAIRIEQQTRVVASGDYCTVERQPDGSINIGPITLKDADELEAFGEALVDVADMLRGKAQQQPSVVDEFNRMAAEAARTAAATSMGKSSF